MDAFGKSQPAKRVEDVRFLTGGGRYVDDIAPEGALYGFVFRSPVAHAEIEGIDVADARAAPGVRLVLTAEDIETMGARLAMAFSRVENRDGTKGSGAERPFLAKGRVRFVGEPVAFIVAETLAQARDAAELIEFDYNDLPVKLDVVPGGQTLHDDTPDNVVFDWGMGDEAATEAAFKAAAKTVSLSIDDNRVICNSMEPRGAYAEWANDRLHVCFNGQGVWGLKTDMSETFDLKPEQVRITTPDVGGGFGMKGFAYPEYLMLAAAAIQLKHPVRWMGERTESMLSDNAGRDLVSQAELAFDDDNKITAYRITSQCNMGAYSSTFAQFIQTQLFSRVLTGVYDVQTIWMQATGVFTNTTQVDAYRGAGRPEAIFALERMIDYAARELGVDPWEIRRKNFIPADAFPHDTPVGETYDVGDFHRLLSSAEDHSDRAGFAARRADSEARGQLRGQGLCYYIESILGDPSETAAVEFQDDGTVLIFVGTQSNGQGHETVYAKFLSDQTGIPMDAISVVQGDSDRIPHGGGTGGSRSVTTQNNATLSTVAKMVSQFGAFLADELGVAPEDVSFDDERFRATGRNETPDMLEVAAMARNKGRADLLKITETAKLPGRSFPNGAHVAEVEIDPETGVVTVERYTVVDDFGNLINPMLAEGQVHGGVAQGIGQALTERVVFSEEGQLLTATFMDYAMPRADDLPMIAFSTQPVPSTANILGMKGCGEAGTVGALAAVANGVLDAVWDRGIRQIDMPFTPHRVWQVLNQADGARIAAE